VSLGHSHIHAPHQEVWIDIAEVQLEEMGLFGINAETAASIQSEYRSIGDAGPGPRRLARFVAGSPVHKGPYAADEKAKLAPIETLIKEHNSNKSPPRKEKCWNINTLEYLQIPLCFRK